MVINKIASLYPRDENGNLLPLEVELIVDEKDERQKKLEGEKILITPIPKGELRRVLADARDDDEGKDSDAEIVAEHCKEPSYTLEEAKLLRPEYSLAIVDTILFESGLDVTKPRKKALQEKEDEFSKNSKGLGRKEKKAI